MPNPPIKLSTPFTEIQRSLTNDELKEFLGVKYLSEDVALLLADDAKKRRVQPIFSSGIYVPDIEGAFEYLMDYLKKALPLLSHVPYSEDENGVPNIPEGIFINFAGDLPDKSVGKNGGDQAVLGFFRALSEKYPHQITGLFGNRDLNMFRSVEYASFVAIIEKELEYLTSEKENAFKAGKFKTGVDRPVDQVWVDGGKQLPGEFLINVLLNHKTREEPSTLSSASLEKIIEQYTELLKRLASEDFKKSAQFEYVIWQMMMSRGTVIFGREADGAFGEFTQGSGSSRILKELTDFADKQQLIEDEQAKAEGRPAKIIRVSVENLIEAHTYVKDSNADFYLQHAVACQLNHLSKLTVLMTHGAFSKNFGVIGGKLIEAETLEGYFELYNQECARLVGEAREAVFAGDYKNDALNTLLNLALPGQRNHDTTAIQAFYESLGAIPTDKKTILNKIFSKEDLVVLSGHKPYGPVPEIIRPQFADGSIASTPVVVSDTSVYNRDDNGNWSVTVVMENKVVITGEVKSNSSNVEVKNLGEFRYEVCTGENADRLQGLKLFDPKEFPAEQQARAKNVIEEFCRLHQLDAAAMVSYRVKGINLVKLTELPMYTLNSGGFKYVEKYLEEEALLHLASELFPMEKTFYDRLTVITTNAATLTMN